jgi:putative hydrolase of the HAD superfamily
MSAAVRAVLCDLDDTLFDHAHASRCAIAELHRAVPDFAGWSVDELGSRHRDALEIMHLEVLAGRLTISDARIERFRRLLAAADAADPALVAPRIAQAYRDAYEKGWQPVPGALALLQALKRAGLRTAIVTNNVLTEQRIKLERCELTAYVDALVTSEEVGVQKPGAAIFHTALERVQSLPDHAVMVGDAWATDIEGARGAGLRAVWFNRTGAPSVDPAVPELRSLEPVRDAMRVIVGPYVGRTEL